ncbi:MAG: DUF475 domain-containing protein [Saprospirales bacterium]|nr:MAG: DUF475 domain-containing protein [Saprospirales bacterium]
MLEIAEGHVLLTIITIVLVEIVLGVDNLIILFAVLKKRSPMSRLKIIILGFLLSIGLRAAILGTALTILDNSIYLFSINILGFEMDVGTRGLIFFVAGIYLLAHAIAEIRRYFEGDDIKDENKVVLLDMALPYMIVWVAVIDLVFSYDSLLGVVAISTDFTLLMIGMIISRILIVLFLNKIYRFIHKHPELIVVMFIFLGFIGISLFMEGLHDMQTTIGGFTIRGFPASWLYSIFVLGIIYSIVHSRIKIAGR